ncbi:MAG: 4-alpha-glucanotransferase [Ignavibacteria bacterium]
MIDRSAGVLLHPASLPGKYGIGDLGHEAYKFVDFLEASGHRLWQVFPLGPTGYGDSPYQCLSAFAGNPLLISPQLLLDERLLEQKDIENVPDFNTSRIDFGPLINYKHSLLGQAYQKFREIPKSEKNDFYKFCEKNQSWLDDYALFAASKAFHGGALWTQWPEDIAFRKPDAVKEWTEKLSDDISFHKFIQYQFLKQWTALKKYANSKHIKIIGDLPIFIAYDSADLWANKAFFTVNEKGKLLTVAGVPPDYFSTTGQLWGNPLYRWDEMAKDDFKWWRNRISHLLSMTDFIRIDHFRGFDAFWEIPGDAETAVKGRWVKGPGVSFFETVKKHLGELPIIAEDLGIITKSVEELRDAFNFPGIKILQFAFGTSMENKFLPHNLTRNCIVHTGSHDNDTTRGFFENALLDNKSDIYSFAQKYLGYFGTVEGITLQIIRAAYATVANMVVIPMQDILNLGAEARMNLPGKPGGNWTWRFTWDMVPPDIAGQYKEMAVIFDRPPKPRVHVRIDVE